ncbi:hypothetical protein AVEN_224239-1 [Araneus ventricosus]|uniref:Uncharacterized protein n=1 Tax=Araneus ventricosus TaxID=182803 RepID=A0A4Y2WVZ1_ARAVE|nr:hypothetical protein AVEN_224239-1 [Araneus ventricosus]
MYINPEDQDTVDKKRAYVREIPPNRRTYFSDRCSLQKNRTHTETAPVPPSIQQSFQREDILLSASDIHATPKMVLYSVAGILDTHRGVLPPRCRHPPPKLGYFNLGVKHHAPI